MINLRTKVIDVYYAKRAFLLQYKLTLFLYIIHKQRQAIRVTKLQYPITYLLLKFRHIQ